MPVRNAEVRGWVFYDAECCLCVRGMRRWGGLFARRGFVWLPLQTTGTAARLAITEAQLRQEMWLQKEDGRIVSGIASWSVLMRSVWWLWPLGVLIALPGIREIAGAIYRWVAQNRYCLGGRCALRTRPERGVGAVNVLLLLGLVGFVVAMTYWWPAWIFMWTLGVTLGQFGKWLTWRDARQVGLSTPAGRSLGWFLLWPGLDGRAFFSRAPVAMPAFREWMTALAKLGLGLGLIWVGAPQLLAGAPLAAGWCAMIGIVLVLHFGTFHLLSLAWQSAGVAAAPIMNRPLAAKSLAQLWGERWNTAFSIPARRLIFQPLVRRLGVSGANLAVFAVSGLLHELVISVPARGGYGLPTGYFLLQGAGMWFERSRAGRALGLGKGLRGWLFTMAIAAGPVFWLFHPPFIRNVILPMLASIGATPTQT